jgi:hypothetical protein
VAKLAPIYLKYRGDGEQPDWIASWRDAFLFAHLVATEQPFGPLYNTANRVLTLFTFHGRQNNSKQISDSLKELKRRFQSPEQFRTALRQALAAGLLLADRVAWQVGADQAARIQMQIKNAPRFLLD